MSAVLTREPSELTAANQEIPPALDHIVHHCMEKDPMQHFQSAGDIAFQLGELSGMRSSTTTRAIADSREASEKRKFPNWMLAAIGSAVVALLMVGTWFVARTTVHTDPPKFEQLSFQQGYVDSGRILPDGQSFICAARWGSDKSLALHTGRFDSQGLRPLQTLADAIASVSPEGELLVIQNMKGVGPGYVAGRHAGEDGSRRRCTTSRARFVQYTDWAPGGKDFAVVRFIRKVTCIAWSIR